ncbi:MAG TPA: hypothetical protein VFJ24_12470 [Gaiellales bacterium]|nr:hypothetical protein [Gaiellales bacterium]
MAFADWLLPLLLITLDDEHGRAPFDFTALDSLPLATVPQVPAPAPQV